MAKSFHSVSVVSPIYNNRRTLLPIISSLNSLLSSNVSQYEILLIDDGSTDGSQDILQKKISAYAHVRILYHKENLGIAKTYRHLYKEAKYSNIILFSVDGEWDIHDVIALLEKAKKSNADIVIGERKKKAYSFGRWFISTCYNSMTSLLFGVKTYDAGSIKYVNKKVIYTITIRSRGVFDEAERIIKAAKVGYVITSIPVAHLGSKKTKSFGVKRTLLIEAISDLISSWWNITVLRNVC